MTICFEKANKDIVDIIFSWLKEPHMIEFWDNSQEHKDDILNFIHGRKQDYFAGTTRYWVAYIENEPYAFILSDVIEIDQEDLSEVHKAVMSTIGTNIAIDFGIGNSKYLGKGLAAKTLEEFMIFYKKSVDPMADTFLIDPDANNPRAFHVYEKAGFKGVGEYDHTFNGNISQSILMVKRV